MKTTDNRPSGVNFVKMAERNAILDNAHVGKLVSEILTAVRDEGDAAVRLYSQQFDQFYPELIEVSADERLAALAALEPQSRKDTEFAIANVTAFAHAQLKTILPLEVELLPGVHMGHRIIPLEKVGCYVPGGRYPLLSAPVMTIVPAKVPRVDKIVGPGNAFVNEAKKQVFGPIGIDQLAGPSEIFIIADETGDPEMIATDMLAQAEHDVCTRVGLITTHKPLALAVMKEVERQLLDLSTAITAGQAWKDYGEIALCRDESALIAYSDYIAAEHLQVHTKNARDMALKVRNYGSLFIGELASVVYSDKCSGTNHTLPTLASGRYTGGLWVGDYVKIATHQWLTPEGVEQVAPAASRQAATEGMEGHRRAAQLRLNRIRSGNYQPD